MAFSFEVTVDDIASCCPHNPDPASLLSALEEVLPRYEIDTPERLSAFLAQCAHESGDFTVLEENLNYSAKGLAATWPKRFPSEAAAAPYNRNPEAIANKVYADRMGNGPESSGDGWKHRGRGAIQLTGKSNYQAFANDLGFQSIDDAILYLQTLQGAIESAAWFWWKNNLNPIADNGDMKTLTHKINGGELGLAERVAHFNHNQQVLA